MRHAPKGLTPRGLIFLKGALAEAEIGMLSPVLEQIRMDLEPIDGKNILVLCSAGGDVAFWLAKQMKQGKVIGLELDQTLLVSASQLAVERSHKQRDICRVT